MAYSLSTIIKIYIIIIINQQEQTNLNMQQGTNKRIKNYFELLNNALKQRYNRYKQKINGDEELSLQNKKKNIQKICKGHIQIKQLRKQISFICSRQQIPKQFIYCYEKYLIKLSLVQIEKILQKMKVEFEQHSSIYHIIKKKIEYRELSFVKIQNYLKKLQSQQIIDTKLFDKLIDRLIQYRNQTLQIIEGIMQWKQQLQNLAQDQDEIQQSKIIFYYKNLNILEKIQQDTIQINNSPLSNFIDFKKDQLDPLFLYPYKIFNMSIENAMHKNNSLRQFLNLNKNYLQRLKKSDRFIKKQLEKDNSQQQIIGNIFSDTFYKKLQAKKKKSKNYIPFVNHQKYDTDIEVQNEDSSFKSNKNVNSNKSDYNSKKAIQKQPFNRKNFRINTEGQKYENERSYYQNDSDIHSNAKSSNKMVKLPPLSNNNKLNPNITSNLSQVSSISKSNKNENKLQNLNKFLSKHNAFSIRILSGKEQKEKIKQQQQNHKIQNKLRNYKKLDIYKLDFNSCLQPSHIKSIDNNNINIYKRPEIIYTKTDKQQIYPIQSNNQQILTSLNQTIKQLPFTKINSQPNNQKQQKNQEDKSIILNEQQNIENNKSKNLQPNKLINQNQQKRNQILQPEQKLNIKNDARQQPKGEQKIQELRIQNDIIVNNSVDNSSIDNNINRQKSNRKAQDKQINHNFNNQSNPKIQSIIDNMSNIQEIVPYQSKQPKQIKRPDQNLRQPRVIQSVIQIKQIKKPEENLRQPRIVLQSSFENNNFAKIPSYNQQNLSVKQIIVHEWEFCDYLRNNKFLFSYQKGNLFKNERQLLWENYLIYQLKQKKQVFSVIIMKLNRKNKFIRSLSIQFISGYSYQLIQIGLRKTLQKVWKYEMNCKIICISNENLSPQLRQILQKTKFIFKDPLLILENNSKYIIDKTLVAIQISNVLTQKSKLMLKFESEQISEFSALNYSGLSLVYSLLKSKVQNTGIEKIIKQNPKLLQLFTPFIGVQILHKTIQNKKCNSFKSMNQFLQKLGLDVFQQSTTQISLFLAAVSEYFIFPFKYAITSKYLIFNSFHESQVLLYKNQSQSICIIKNGKYNLYFYKTQIQENLQKDFPYYKLVKSIKFQKGKFSKVLIQQFSKQLYGRVAEINDSLIFGNFFFSIDQDQFTYSSIDFNLTHNDMIYFYLPYTVGIYIEQQGQMFPLFETIISDGYE